ncbi:MAG: polyketide synthase dehydratase domain-containing protein, partial [Myxococcota bacterium]
PPAPRALLPRAGARPPPPPPPHDVVVRSLGWGPWRGGMVGPELAAHFEARGVPLIEAAAGAAAFVREFRPGPETAVTLGPGFPPAAGRSRPDAVDVPLDPRAHPYLDDHRIDGRVVMPVATAIELFARSLAARTPPSPDTTPANGAPPQTEPLRLDAVQVLRGLTFDDLETTRWLRVLFEEGDDDALRLTLVDERMRPRFRATMPRTQEAGPPAVLQTPDEPPPPPRPSVYDDANLFHGPSLRVLTAVEALGASGAVARVAHDDDDGRGRSGFAIDVPLVDGALQLALVAALVGGASLPTAIASVVIHRRGRVTGPARAVLVVRARDDASGEVTSDVQVADDTGLIATLRGVVTHRRPGGRTVVEDRSQPRP